MVVGNQALFSLSFWLLSRKLNKGFFANVTARKPSLWKLKFPKIRIFAKNTSGKLLRTKAKMYVFSIHAIAILRSSRNVRYVIYDASKFYFPICILLTSGNFQTFKPWCKETYKGSKNWSAAYFGEAYIVFENRSKTIWFSILCPLTLLLSI